MSFSLCLNHTQWVPARVDALDEMKDALAHGLASGVAPTWYVNDTDYRGTDWQQSKVTWALDQWQWSAKQDTTHHVFMTDDLNIAPRFWDILQAMTTAHPNSPVGLLSNHPDGPTLFRSGVHTYKCNSWIVGPAYVLPHAHLVSFLEWFKSRSFDDQMYDNDDSNCNRWITERGPGHSLHPLPTIIEHRGDIGSTVGHGDEYSRERLSWRAERWTEKTPTGFEWKEKQIAVDLEAMCRPDYWSGMSPMLKVG